MHVEWYGQSAFRLEAEGATVFIDPFGDMSAAAARGMQFDYPAIEGVSADLLLVTHEHFDHNGVEAIDGSPKVLRSTAGTLESPIGEVVAVASEHDQAAGTQRGPNTIFVFELGGVRVCHFGDFGQAELRDAQERAIGRVDLLFLPVGGGPTIGAEGAATIAERLSPAGSCRCTTAPRGSASSRPPTRSSSGWPASRGSTRPASTPTRWTTGVVVPGSALIDRYWSAQRPNIDHYPRRTTLSTPRLTRRTASLQARRPGTRSGDRATEGTAPGPRPRSRATATTAA